MHACCVHMHPCGDAPPAGEPSPTSHPCTPPIPTRSHIQVLQDISAPGSAPDVVFSDPTFSPLWGDSSGRQQLVQLLSSWEPSQPEGLTALFDLLLDLYLEHQKAKLLQLHDERLQFELAMMESLGFRCDSCHSWPAVVPSTRLLGTMMCIVLESLILPARSQVLLAGDAACRCYCS